LQYPDVLVYENACNELDDLEAVEAMPALTPLLDDPHPHIQQAARTGLDNLQRVQQEKILLFNRP
jgi:hypothetical protein